MRFAMIFALGMTLPLFAPTESAPLLVVVRYTQRPPASMACADPWVIDGDSIRCSNLGEIRLLGIDAPDYRDSPPCQGHFGNYVCDDAGGSAAKRALIQLRLRMPGAQWEVLPVTRGRYGRLVAEVRAGGVDLSCYQLGSGSARHIPQYDSDRRIARNCGAAR